MTRAVRQPAPIHGLPVGASRGHFASSTCPCQPAQTHVDAATTAPIYVHQALAQRATGEGGGVSPEIEAPPPPTCRLGQSTRPEDGSPGRDEPQATRSCPICARPISVTPGRPGRPPAYCCDRCRQVAEQRRRDREYFRRAERDWQRQAAEARTAGEPAAAVQECLAWAAYCAGEAAKVDAAPPGDPHTGPCLGLSGPRIDGQPDEPRHAATDAITDPGHPPGLPAAGDLEDDR